MTDIDTTATIIPFSRRRRWRWWAMVVMGTMFVTYSLVMLSSPAWDNRQIFGVHSVWLWLRGEAYLIFGFFQCLVGGGYVYLTSGPSNAIVADNNGITVRRLFGPQTLNWSEVQHVKKGRSSLLVAATPISLWKLFLCDPRLMRLDTTMVDASAQTLLDMIERHGRASSTPMANLNAQ